MRTLFLSLFSASVLFSAPVWAQSQTPQQADPQADTSPDDEVMVYGTLKGVDAAMSAFFAGDFETAEIEFERNFESLRIAENRKLDSAMRLRMGSLAGSENTGGQGYLSDVGSADVNSIADLNVSTANAVSDLNRGVDRSEEIDENSMQSGTDLGFQLYMAGLSELQQGKYEEAEAHFDRAIGLNNRLYDARYRLALLHILNDQPEKARPHFKVIQKRYRKCQEIGLKMCKERPDLEEAVTVLESQLG